MKRELKKTTLSIAVAQAVLICGSAFAQTAAPAKEEAVQTIVVTGQRAAMQSAQKLKQNAEEIIDGVVAEEAGKLPDRSITEVLQRVVGVTIDRNRSRGDPEHFSVEGSGISVRGLSWGSSTLNGRESFSAGWPGRELSWGDVPPELMSAVIVHKNPPAQLIEGGVSGQVDLRTALPFDYKGEKLALSTYANYAALGSSASPAVSGLYSNRWKTDAGEFGALIDLSANRTTFRNDTVQLDAYFPHPDNAGKIYWSPKSASWRTNTGKSDRKGIYGALQWKKNGFETALTYFQSQYKTQDTENALYTAIEDPYKVVLKNPVYDSNNVLQSATYTYPIGGIGANRYAAGGLGFSSDTGYSDGNSKSREIAWNAKWTINERWAVQNDLQWVHATNSGIGGNMTLNTFVPSMNVDASASPARITFDDATRNFLSDPANYYLDHQMPGMGKAEANLYAWKTDVTFKFDHDVLRDLRFGVRLTKRDSTKIDSSGQGWWSLAQPWFVKTISSQPAGTMPLASDDESWKNRGSVGYLSDPRYAALVPVTTANFANFFNGKIGAPPTLVVPTMAYTRDPASYAANNQILALECQDANNFYHTSNVCTGLSPDWKPESFDGAPEKTRLQDEKTKAIYGSLRFGFDDWRFPLEGNVGVRVVRTESTSHGYTIFQPTYGSNTAPSAPRFGPINAPIDDGNSFVNTLPSLNLKMDLTPKLQARFAFAQAMYRPSFGDLSEYIQLQQNITTTDGVTNISYTGSDSGNAKLKPVRSNNFDVSLEWYPGDGSSLTATVFYKDVKDIVLKSANVRSYNDLAGNPQDFLVTSPQNAAKGSVTGFEVAGQAYFDHVPMFKGMLPEWAKGFGITANYTYLKSKQDLYHPFNLKYCPANGSFNNAAISLYGCDTNGLPFTSMPIQYLSPNAYNLTILYDKGPLSARLAYSWRSRFLQGVSTNGTNGDNATSADPTRPPNTHDVAWGLPTWQEATGQLDAGVDYKITPRFTASFSASNLTDAMVRQTQQQGIGFTPRAYFEPGRSYRLALRYSY